MADFGNEGMADLYRRPGETSTVYADVSQDASDPRRTSTLRQRTVAEALSQAGAPVENVAAIEAILEQPHGIGGPVSRLIVAREGVVELSELLPGEPLAELIVGHGAVPQLAPLLIQRPRDVTYVVAEVGRDGGEIRLARLSRATAIAEQSVAGETEFITKVHGEDNFLANGRYQHHTEEIWKRNEALVASALDAIVRDSGAELIVLTGDVRARQLLVDQIAPATREILTELPANTRSSGATNEVLQQELERHIASILAHDEYGALERIAAGAGREDGLAETDFWGVLRSLQHAQVDVLVVAPDAMPVDELIALDREPWVAAPTDDTLGATSLGPVPAVDALLRAAILTDARVVVVSPDELPKRSSAAALLRWPTVSSATD
ncbi:hypothetical protein [Cryobacterium psychrophilum]|uniref:Peptide chain release factor 1 n=1 Tax=Cryobacterium psychrophilum TaxID=41988 RepID=A0A4Y8KII8_9MICO|nr:hypothetical protein [Cryobacterium psychrophilum]TDW30054.1 hypothetical protein EDD25_1788 [Cryobacterium psychrophilum]TFD75501.1 hypothetical protein E3T53_15520 [Cryobacterium psychrophilum]